ncbi:nuclease-related domain-containing protein [Fredinandcohnia sp. QZ13]|uniref:nuclease-related domain-containing protein n=1 Tax=Fredinandcohnia sp. QZ13 TaxID=3073144 RepID=UPI0028531804|nr:nuclease-related domain-containing protein [Fredinandcohnia sp. QZ13]MDR4889156.1 nuclease-related domain-containing protein [Fredinandcohnia sp. QZ13]
MITKSRTVPIELLHLRSIRARQKVSEKIENQVHTLEKGFSEETWFDQRLESLSLDCLILNDLLLETNNTHYQIDSLLISRRKIHLFEVKNYEGDYVVNEDRWQSLSSGIEMKNPLLQLTRSESLFRQLLQQLGSDFTVESHLVFINPEFYLYQVPPNLPIIFPFQLTRFMNNLSSQSSSLVEKHHTLAKKLLSLHIKKSPFSLLPQYSFGEMEKGILCIVCWNEFLKYGNQHKLTCPNCGSWEAKESAVTRSIEEFEHLFPELKITVSTIFEWCKVIKSKKTIRKILSKNYNLIQSGRSSYYERSK